MLPVYDVEDAHPGARASRPHHVRQGLGPLRYLVRLPAPWASRASPVRFTPKGPLRRARVSCLQPLTLRDLQPGIRLRAGRPRIPGGVIPRGPCRISPNAPSGSVDCLRVSASRFRKAHVVAAKYHSPLEGESQKPEPNGEGFCGGGFAPAAPNGAVLCAVAGSHQPTYRRRPMGRRANAALAGSTPGGLPHKKRGLEDPDPFQERHRRANRRIQAVAFSFLPPRPFTSIFFGTAAGARGAVISRTPLWKEAEILSRSVPFGKSRVCSYLP